MAEIKKQKQEIHLKRKKKSKNLNDKKNYTILNISPQPEQSYFPTANPTQKRAQVWNLKRLGKGLR